MEPVQTAYRRSARAAGYEPHGAVGPQPEGLHGLSGVLLFAGDLRSRYHVAEKRAFITYRTVQREPYRINRLSYDFRDRFLEQIILPDTVHSLLRTGEVFDMEVLDQERQRITTYLKQRGYYNFTVNNIEYEADTLGGNHLVDLKMIVKQHLAGYNEQGYPILRNNTVYRIDQINIFPITILRRLLLPTTARDSTRSTTGVERGVPQGQQASQHTSFGAATDRADLSELRL